MHQPLFSHQVLFLGLLVGMLLRISYILCICYCQQLEGSTLLLHFLDRNSHNSNIYHIYLSLLYRLICCICIFRFHVTSLNHPTNLLSKPIKEERYTKLLFQATFTNSYTIHLMDVP